MVRAHNKDAPQSSLVRAVSGSPYQIEMPGADPGPAGEIILHGWLGKVEGI